MLVRAEFSVTRDFGLAGKEYVQVEVTAWAIWDSEDADILWSCPRVLGWDGPKELLGGYTPRWENLSEREQDSAWNALRAMANPDALRAEAEAFPLPFVVADREVA